MAKGGRWQRPSSSGPDSAEFLVRSSNLRASGRHRVRDGPGSGAEPFGHAVSDLAEVDSPKEHVDSEDVGLARARRYPNVSAGHEGRRRGFFG